MRPPGRATGTCARAHTRARTGDPSAPCHNQWYGRPANPRRAAAAARPAAAAGARDARLEGHAGARRARRPTAIFAATEPEPDTLVDHRDRRRTAGPQRPARAQLALAQRADPRALQPDLPQPGPGRQRQGRLLDQRRDHRPLQERDPVPVERHAGRSPTTVSCSTCCAPRASRSTPRIRTRAPRCSCSCSSASGRHCCSCC